jgi:DNA mismatch endonuclease (patch repair protein)
LENLLEEGVLVSGPLGCILQESLKALTEPEHFVTCKACGAQQGQITSKHLRACSNIDLAEYAKKWPDALTLSKFVSGHKEKTPEQKEHQSDTLKKRFQTPEGEVTRKQISDAAVRMMATDYRAQATKHLQDLNNSEEQRAFLSIKSKERWANGTMREKVQTWHKENREFSLNSANHARGHISRTFSKPHQKVEAALIAAGLKGLLREHSIGHYRVDEALPDLKLAIEIDGCYWHGCAQCGFEGVGVIKTLDKRKGTYLQRHGWEVLHILEHDIAQNLSVCVEQVMAAVRRRTNAGQ